MAWGGGGHGPIALLLILLFASRVDDQVCGSHTLAMVATAVVPSTTPPRDRRS
jgi:hypothetical protein